MVASEGVWFEEEPPESDVEEPIEYDLAVTASDFNTRTIYDFVEQGAVKIPGFQRNYVWDIKRASKLIESLIIGLPVPQLFLYEESRNNFLVIDGQQRLLSMYYFFKQRFPLLERRGELRRIADEIQNRVPDSLLYDDQYFTNFNLKLPERVAHQPNRFNGLNYATLPAEHRTAFDLRPIRNIIVKQSGLDGDDSAMYEIFNRLNSGGMLLTPQEIRSSLYHSKFYEMLFRLNVNPTWRRFVGLPEPDLHIKDIEFLLRAFAMLIDGAEYNPSMIKFLNAFSKKAKGFSEDLVSTYERQFEAFLGASEELNDKAFRTQTNRFSITIFESVFFAVVKPFMESENFVAGRIDPGSVARLKERADFSSAVSSGTTSTANVEKRLSIARKTLRMLK